jgi:glycosyltransferase involved in cell wall biosynthesis
MYKMPRVSVLLPNYNYARFLKERIRSILNQTWTDFELLYIDDASTDNSNAVAEQFSADPRVKLHPYSENSGGVYSRRMHSIEMAQGDWLWIAEADDSAHPRFLESLLALADEHPTAGILHCRMATMDTAGRFIGVGWNAEPIAAKQMECSYFAPGTEDAVRMTAACFYSSSSAMLLRKSDLVACGGYDSRLKSAADWDLYLRLLRRCDAAFLADALAYYRSHSQSVTRSTAATVRAVEDAYCIASFYQAMCQDDRFSPADRDLVRRRVSVRLFDIFVDSSTEIPENLRFAVETIHAVTSDRRLLNALKKVV